MISTPDARRAGLLVLLGFALTVIPALLSQGVYHEDDLKHFLYARWSRHDPRYLLETWGRPGFTIPYAPAAMIGSASTGFHAARLVSAALTAATAWFAYRIARRLGVRHAWFAVPLVYLQPLMLRLSLTTLTETPTAFYFALATWLLLRGSSTGSAAAFSLALVTRHEAIALLPVWAIALRQHRAHWFAWPLLVWAPLAHNLLAAWAFDAWPAAIFLEPATTTRYGQGTPLTFVPRLLWSAGPVVAVLAILGALRMLRCRGQWLIPAAAFAWFAAQTAIYMRGAYASGGYPRFLVPIAPWVAVTALVGLQPFLLRRAKAVRRRSVAATAFMLAALWALCEVEWWSRPPVVRPQYHDVMIAGRIAAGVFAAALAVAWYVLRQHRSGTATRAMQRFVLILGVVLLAGAALPELRPLGLLPQHHVLRDAAKRITASHDHETPLITANYWLYYWTDNWAPIERADLREELSEASAGTLFVWDARFCPEPEIDLPLAELLDDPDWRHLWTMTVEPDESPFVAVFRRIEPGATQPTSRVSAALPPVHGGRKMETDASTSRVRTWRRDL